MGYAHGHKWTNQDIIESIKEVIDFYGLDRMPSKQEIEEFYGNSALTNKISKTGGFYVWAKNLGLKVKDSETKMGLELEVQMMKILKEMGFKCETTSTKYPYDLLVNGCVKIDVKAARKTKIRGSDAYSFRLTKEQQTCDVYIAVCVNDKREIQRIYVIPAHITTGKIQLCMGAIHSRYDSYVDRWDIIERFSEAFYKIQ